MFSQGGLKGKGRPGAQNIKFDWGGTIGTGKAKKKNASGGGIEEPQFESHESCGWVNKKLMKEKGE